MKTKEPENGGNHSGPASHQHCVFSSCFALQTDERGVFVATAAVRGTWDPQWDTKGAQQLLGDEQTEAHMLSLEEDSGSGPGSGSGAPSSVAAASASSSLSPFASSHAASDLASS